MKILQICAFAAPYPGNFISSLRVLESKIKAVGGDVIYAFPESARGLEWCIDLEKENKIYYLPLSKARILPKTYNVCRQIFKENKIDIIHSHFELYDMPITICAPKGAKVFWHLHDPIEDAFTKSNILRKCLWYIQYKYIGKRVNILSVSEKHGMFLKKVGFKGDLYFIPNGIDLNRIGEKNKYNRNKKYLMFGWDVYRKGVDLAISASKKLYKYNKNFELICVGQDKCEKYILDADIDNGNYITYCELKSDVNELYENADIFLHISRSEGLSYALLEAIYFGLPVICSDIDENKFARKFNNVYFVRNNDEEDIYNKMKQIGSEDICISNIDLEINRKLIYKEYSLETWSDRILDKYEMV